MQITNTEFLAALFGADAPWVHVTDFPYDPGDIPKDKHLIAWKGDYFSRYNLAQGTNQYFTISNFYADEEQQARRRKALFRHTPVIVLDDVKEKLSMAEVSKLPPPAWILETSPGSEQWGYILDTPCADRARVENLLDGLVANGLAPDGRDPGMKGVTRYVRLPEGYNSKASKLVNGLPRQCQMLKWEPFNRVTIEQLASPFVVDLDAPRRESRIDGAAAVGDHPLINIPEIIHIKEVRSDGRFDIRCPWVDDHTGADDSGSAVFTNADGSIGFKCHHGACQERTGRDLLSHIDEHSPGFSGVLKNWQIMREFAAVSEPSFLTPSVETETVSFLTPQAPVAQPSTLPSVGVDAIQMLCDSLRREHPSSKEARELAASILKHTDDLPKLDQIPYHNTVCDLMSWGKGDFKDILKDLRKQWYGDKVSNAEFYDTVVYVKELNQFYDWKSRIFFSTEAFQNSFSHEDAEARKIALQDGRVRKVDRLDYAPKMPQVFIENDTVYANTWSEVTQNYGTNGDIQRWRDHFDALGWSQHLKHIEQWMAFTLRHPDRKINHMLLLGSGEGAGKDYLLYPLTKAMGENYTVISGEELLRDFDDHLLSTKYLHINEAELGDRREALAVSNKLKPLAAAPPDTLRVNQKGIKPIKIRNILSVSMTTNSMLPLRLNGPSRRIFGAWSDLNIRDENDNMVSAWKDYWEDRWNWMKGEGWKNVAWHLMYRVDLSDFNPNEAPPMTDFLRDIREASKSPMQTTIETFIKKRHGAFRCDLLTAGDMCDTLKAGAAFAPNDMYVDGRYMTPIKIGMVMKEVGTFHKLNAYYLGSRTKLWVLRNRAKYEAMDSQALHHEYERQMAEARGAATLQVVR
jgi:hypothetical protein